MRQLLSHVKKARGRPVGFIAKKLADVLRSEARRVLDAVGESPYRAKCVDDCYLGPDGCEAQFFFDPDDIEYLCGIMRSRIDCDSLITSADSITSGIFRLLGRELYWDRGVQWHGDATEDFTWPLKFHSCYRYSELIDADRSTDIKVPWEMGRLQSLPLLALAYRFTCDPRYINRLQSLLADWHSSNPVGWGIGWACPMDASLRAINLIWAMRLTGSLTWNERNRRWLLTMLEEHGRFMYRNIEYSDINGNHNTACLLGLLYLGISLRQVAEGGRWLARSLQGLQKEIGLQTYEDGVCHEGSIPYHRLVTEMFLHAGLLCRNNGIALEPQYWLRLEAMLDFIQAYTKPNGDAPLFGDGDDGRVIRLGSQGINDHRYLLAIGAALFGRADMKASAGPLSADAVWLMGKEGMAAYDAIDATPVKRQPRAFPEGGYWILANDLGDHAIIDCGDVGLRGRGGHGHLDVLSVEVNLAGHDVVVDTGCITYSASREKRRQEISAAAHNAVMVDGLEPASIIESDILSVSPYHARPMAWAATDSQCSFTGEHFGYRRLPGCVTCRRTVSMELSRHRIALLEELEGNGTHCLTWRFHVAPQWTAPLLDSDEARVLLVSESFNATCILEIGDFDGRVEFERSRYYPSYGASEHSWTIVLQVEAELPYHTEFGISVEHEHVAAAPGMLRIES